jgi:hypothetical protein
MSDRLGRIPAGWNVIARARLMIAFVGAASACGAVAATAHAQQRAVVREFSGPGGKSLRQGVVKAVLRDGKVELVAAEEVGDKAASIGADVSTDAGRRDVATEMALSTFLEGEVEKKGPRSTLTVRVYDGASGGLAGEATFAGRMPALAKRVQAGFWAELGGAIEGTSAPIREAPPEEEAAVPLVPVGAEEDPPEEPPEDENDPEHDAGDPRPTFLGARLALGGTTRDFSYNDAFPGLRGYCLGPQCDAFGLGPVVLLDGQWYPGAHFGDGFAAHLGFDLRGSMMFGITSKQRTSGQEFTTSHAAWGAGLRLRVPLDDHELHVVVGYGNSSFEVGAAGGASPDVPGVSYGFVRLGAGGRVVVGDPVSLSFAAAYLLPLAYGEIAETQWFPNTGGGGLEGELLVGFALAKWLDLTAGASFTRFFLSHDPDPSDDSVTALGRVAGGAVDQYVGMRVGLALRL